MTRPRILTYAWLADCGACTDQRDLAALHFGASAPLTRQTLAEVAALGLGLGWLASALHVDHTTWQAANAVVWTSYLAAIAEPLRVRLAATAACDAASPGYTACAESWRVYDAACAGPRGVRDAACAEALADLLGLP